MQEITIETTDFTFIEDIRELNQLGFIEIYEPMARAYNTIDTPKPLIFTLTIAIFTNIAGGVLANWIYERYKEKPQNVPIINHQTITNQFNIENLTIIINEGKSPKEKQENKRHHK